MYNYPITRNLKTYKTIAPKSNTELKALETLPALMDLREKMPPVYDQGDEGSCTANAIVGLAEYLMLKAGQPYVALSRQFVYYGERVIEGDVGTDGGALIEDGMRIAVACGICPETDDKYCKETFAVMPGQQAVIVRNSWGASWGLQGYFYLPYYFWSHKLILDMWTGK